MVRNVGNHHLDQVLVKQDYAHIKFQMLVNRIVSYIVNPMFLILNVRIQEYDKCAYYYKMIVKNTLDLLNQHVDQ